jgi:hypothetical protein
MKDKMNPIGLMPKNIHTEIRFKEVCGAMSRYYNACLIIPIEWIEEYNELVSQLYPQSKEFKL